MLVVFELKYASLAETIMSGLGWLSENASCCFAFDAFCFIGSLLLDFNV